MMPVIIIKRQNIILPERLAKTIRVQCMQCPFLEFL